MEWGQLGLCKTGFAEDTFFLLNILRKTQIGILRGSSKLSEKLLCTKKSSRSGGIQVLFYSSELNELRTFHPVGTNNYSSFDILVCKLFYSSYECNSIAV